MLKIAFVGWRGMVGSVLMDRMRAEGDFEGIAPRFYSTSNPGGEAPAESGGEPLADAFELTSLAQADVVLTCQGSGYTRRVYGELRASGWGGLWIDASSALRTDDDSMLVLDPVNGPALREGLASGVTTYCGANCTVSLLLLATLGLWRSGEVEWMSSMTYQAASGAGAGLMRELVAQMGHVGRAAADDLAQRAPALQLDQTVAQALAEADAEVGRAPLAGSALPWIDSAMPSGQTREEWKATVEASKLLDTPATIDGVCVRIGALRSHAQGLTIKLRRPIAPDELEAMIAEAHPWVEVVPNEQEASLARLTPAAVAGSLQVPIGRLRQTTIAPDMVAAFTVGDQLLWGAAEPLRRMLHVIREHRGL